MDGELERIGSSAPLINDRRGDVMVEPEAVSAMLRLKQLGWGTRRIAVELGVSRTTVKDWLAAGGWQVFAQPTRRKKLDGHADWLRERFRQHRGNADVVRQELAAGKGVVVSLRTVERAVEPYRAELEAEARATVRFETAPGKQMRDAISASGWSRSAGRRSRRSCSWPRSGSRAACTFAPSAMSDRRAGSMGSKAPSPRSAA